MSADEKYEVPAIYEAPTITVLGDVIELTQAKHGCVADMNHPATDHDNGHCTS
jgi:hypothetical protein